MAISSNHRAMMTVPQGQPHEQQQQARPIVCTVRDLECYAIRLEPEQSLHLYGFLNPKRTLTWRDVLDNHTIHLNACISCGLPGSKLHRMQSDIKEWIRYGKATVADCQHMGPWKPNPFTDLGCSIGDLVLYRQMLPATLLIESGVTFASMRDLHGLTPELMGLLHYSVDEWLQLGVDEAFLHLLMDDQWLRVFGLVKRHELIAQVRRRHQALLHDGGNNNNDTTTVQQIALSSS